MKKAIFSSAMILAMLPAASAPAMAQQSAFTQEGAPSVQEYVLQEDGTLVVGGDGLIDCPSIALGVEQYPIANLDTQAELDEARETLALCEQYGFMNSDGEVAPATSSPGADSPVFQPAEPDAVGEAMSTQQPSTAQAVLPATGGPKLTLAAPSGGMLLLAGLAALGFAARRRLY